jgi:peptide/nickel transport system substrate-binding protein
VSILKKGETDGAGYSTYLWANGTASQIAIYPNLNFNDPAWREVIRDARFRRALSMGIDRRIINRALYFGMAKEGGMTALSRSPLHDPANLHKWADYDPDRANALLDEMGLTEKDGQGYRLKPDGKRLTIIFSYAPVFGSWGDIGVLLSEHWKQLGIELILDETNRQLYSERFLANEHDMAIFNTAAEFNPLILPMHFVPIHGNSRQAIPAAKWYLSGGAEGEAPTGDLLKCYELWDEIKATADFEEQKRLFRQILELNKENLWVIGICTAPPELVIVKNNFRNVPQEAVSDWNLLTPGATATEQYFIKQS